MTSKTRNIIDSILCFLSCCFLGGIALAFWMVHEVNQSDNGGFNIERNDILRYSFCGACGYIINAALIFIGCGNGWFG